MRSERPKRPAGVVSRSFPISGSTFEDVREFVREYLRGAPEESSGLEEIAAAAAQAAGQGAQPVYLTIRMFTDHVELMVGSSPASGLRFREWFADALRRDGLSQEAAARRLGVSLKTVNRWLRGHSEPRMRELRRVRQEFGQPPLD
jgi:DNA-binding XRE family transcriptional regulator